MENSMNKSLKQTQAERLIEQRLSVEEFVRELGKFGVHVVSPGENTPANFYMDERRFFPELDDEHRVIGGYFG